MGWSIGFDEKWQRDIGYGVPATCDHTGCGANIDRGLSYVCGGEPYGGDYGCGLYFCKDHLYMTNRGQQCERCTNKQDPFSPTLDRDLWVKHKLSDPSWQGWRDENPDEVAALKLLPDCAD